MAINDEWTLKGNPSLRGPDYGEGNGDTIRGALGLVPNPTVDYGTGPTLPAYRPSGLPGYSLATHNLFAEALRVKKMEEAKKDDRPTPVELLAAFKADQEKVAKANEEQRARQREASSKWDTMLGPEGPIQGLDKQAGDLRIRMIEPVQQFATQGLDWLEQARERARELGPHTEAAATKAIAFVNTAKENALDTYKNQAAKVGILKTANLWSDFNEQAELFRQRHAGDMTSEQIESNVYQMRMGTLQQASIIGAQLDIQYETSRASMNQAYDELIANSTHLADWKTSTAYSAGAAEETRLATVASSMKQVALQWLEQAEIQSARLTELASTLYARGLAEQADFLVSLDSYVDPFLSDLYIYGEALAELNYQPQYRSVSTRRADRGGSRVGPSGGSVGQQALGVTPEGSRAATGTVRPPQPQQTSGNVGVMGDLSQVSRDYA